MRENHYETPRAASSASGLAGFCRGTPRSVHRFRGSLRSEIIHHYMHSQGGFTDKRTGKVYHSGHFLNWTNYEVGESASPCCLLFVYLFFFFVTTSCTQRHRFRIHWPQVLNEPNLKGYMSTFNSTPDKPACVTNCQMVPLPHDTYVSVYVVWLGTWGCVYVAWLGTWVRLYVAWLGTTRAVISRRRHLSTPRCNAGAHPNPNP